jgi:hypothetical protein
VTLLAAVHPAHDWVGGPPSQCSGLGVRCAEIGAFSSVVLDGLPFAGIAARQAWFVEGLIAAAMQALCQLLPPPREAPVAGEPE